MPKLSLERGTVFSNQDFQVKENLQNSGFVVGILCKISVIVKKSPNLKEI